LSRHSVMRLNGLADYYTRLAAMEAQAERDLTT
jgi:hypothetical protein